MNDLQEATKKWVEAVRDYYKDQTNLTQVFFRGYFAGMSEGEVLLQANRLAENAEKYPSHHIK